MRKNKVRGTIPNDSTVRYAASTAVIMLLLFLVWPIAARAASLSGDSNTYVSSREDADGSKVLGAYEYLNLSAGDPGKELSFQFGGWLRYDFKTEEFGNKSTSDLQYAYLSYKSSNSNAVVNLGRVMVFEGVATDRVDGIYARTDLAKGFGVSAFGGVPVETEINLPGNDIIYGARLTHQIPGLYRIGISALKEEKNSEDFRKEEGIDLWFRPINKIELMGNSKYNEITKDWASHQYFLVLGPFANIRFNTEASFINYKDYFTGATSSAFMFQPAVLDQNEKVTILGEQVAFGVTDNLNISVDFKGYTYSIAGDAKYYGGNIKYSVAKKGGAGLSVHVMDGKDDRLKYDEYRAYVFGKFGKAEVTLDGLDVSYKEPINGVKDAYSISLAAAYELMEKLKVGADVEYAKNPDFDKDIRTFFKLIYSFDVAYGKGKEGV